VKNIAVQSIEIDLDFVAAEINAEAGEDVETPDTVKAWIQQNHSMLRSILQDGLVARIGEAYQ
jgi:hypothetical protein